MYQLKAVCPGLSTVFIIFTDLYELVSSRAHMGVIHISSYFNNWYDSA